MNMSLAPGYSYAIADGSRGPVVTLTQVATGKTKEFPHAASYNATGLARHMESLTEDQCGSWFQTKDKKTKSKVDRKA